MTDASFDRCTAALVRFRREFEVLTAPATDLLFAQLAPTHADVLDLASGIGDPALRLAAALGSSGRVTALDRAPAFLQELAREAAARRLGNVTVVEGDLASLPFEAASFDAVVSRLGLPFASDAGEALAEVVRVLRPGGRAAFVVWGSPDQPLMRLPLGSLFEASGMPALVVGQPGPFRFSAAGSLTEMLSRAGFQDVREGTSRTAWRWPGAAETFWEATLETAAPLLEPLLAELDVASRRRLIDGILAGLRRAAQGDSLFLEAEVHWAAARKP